VLRNHTSAIRTTRTRGRSVVKKVGLVRSRRRRAEANWNLASPIPVGAVYFPQYSVVSLVTVLSNGSQIEAATVGNEGMVGMSAMHGPGVAQHRTVQQVADGCWRLPVATFHELIQTCPGLVSALEMYSEALIFTLAQPTACMAAHQLAQRCARWCWLTTGRQARPSSWLMSSWFRCWVRSVRAYPSRCRR
jgi:hypothetical protein